LTQRGQEYLLVTADPASQSCMKIGSDKGRQFLDVNSEVVINFFSYCFGNEWFFLQNIKFCMII